MRTRIVLTGIGSGITCLAALWFPWYMMEPAQITSDWGYANQAAVMPEWTGIAIAIFCGLALFTFGWVSARWAWAADWRESLLAGTGAGIVAGGLVYSFLGAFHFGLAGQAPILEQFHNEINERGGMILLVNALSESAMQMSMGSIFTFALCAITSGLGGLASAVDIGDTWGKPPHHTDTWLSRLSAYGLTISGAAWMVFGIAILSPVQDAAVNTAIEYELAELTSYPFFILPIFYLTTASLVLVPMSVTWGWALREWKGAGMWRVTYALWLAATVALTAWMLRGFIRTGEFFFIEILAGISLPLSWTVFLLSIGTGFCLGYASKPVSGSPLPLRASDWAGYALTQGVLGGTQFFLSAPAYAVALAIILITNIPHLTQSGAVESPPAEQIHLLFNMLNMTAAMSILLALFAGLAFGMVALLIRKFLKIAPVKTEPNPP